MAAKSLCLIREPIAIEPIRKCLNDENEYVRRMAERAISTLEKNNS
jgi:HEAT repeat protein